MWTLESYLLFSYYVQFREAISQLSWIMPFNAWEPLIWEIKIILYGYSDNNSQIDISTSIKVSERILLSYAMLLLDASNQGSPQLPLHFSTKLWIFTIPLEFPQAPIHLYVRYVTRSFYISCFQYVVLNFPSRLFCLRNVNCSFLILNITVFSFPF